MGTIDALAFLMFGQGVWGSAFNQSLNQKYDGPEVDHDSTLTRWKAATPGLMEFAHFNSSGNTAPIVIFEHTAPSSCVRIKQTRTAYGARGDLIGERSKSAFLDLRHRPVGMYANEPLSGWKRKPLGAVKSALCHGDRDKLVSQPLDFELL